MNERLQDTYPEWHNPFSRRALLIALGCGALEACSGGDHSPLPSKETITPLPKIPDGPFVSDFKEQINDTYLHTLLQELQQEAGDRQTRVNATIGSLRLIQNLSTGAFEATAFQIDNSGYFVAAKHSVPADPRKDSVIIINPYDGSSVLVVEFRVNPEADVAIMFAPTAKPPQKTPNMQLDFTGLVQHEQLWMIGLVPHQTVYRRIITGQVDTSVPLRPLQSNDVLAKQARDTRVAVRGMIPYGGMSGSPLVNNQGVIVGVEAGAYPDDARTVDTYKGAVVTPLAYLQTASYKLSIL